ncbi:MAG: hypothetical protein U0871_29585 [Gemmataceae bacterium]
MDRTPTDPARGARDPGGAHAKGFTAEQGDGPDVPADGPLPLADAPPGAAVHQAEKDSGTQPTGRTEPGMYNPNDTMLGAG